MAHPAPALIHMAKKKIWRLSKNTAENAKLVLPPLAVEFFQAGRKAVAEEAGPDRLHPLRLKTKRFRYTLELFKPCYGAGLERRLGALKQIQDYLGDISDYQTTCQLLERLPVRGSAQETAFLKFLHNRSARRAADFRKHWKETFDRAGQQRWWTDYLSRFAGRGRRTRRSPR